MRFSMLYSGEQILSFNSCLVFYAGDSLNYMYFSVRDRVFVVVFFCLFVFFFFFFFFFCSSVFTKRHGELIQCWIKNTFASRSIGTGILW